MKIKFFNQFYSVRGFAIIYSMLILFVLLACGGDREPEKISEIKEGVTKTKQLKENLKKAPTYVEQLREHTERLKSMEPVDKQKLISWFPENIEEFTRNRIKENRSGFDNATVIRAYYTGPTENGQPKKLDIEIMDGAGPQGSLVVPGLIARRQLNMDM